jgi:hypothetical protein
MDFRLMETVSEGWRPLNGSPLLAEVVKGTILSTARRRSQPHENLQAQFLQIYLVRVDNSLVAFVAVKSTLQTLRVLGAAVFFPRYWRRYMLSTFKTKEEFLGAVSSQLEKQQSESNIRSALLAGVSSAEDDLRNESAEEESQAFHLKMGSWVIRDDDIPIFEAVNSTATAVALTLTTAGIAWPAVATTLITFANVCWRVWRRGVHLSSRQVSVYGFLKAQGPMTLIALTDGLKKAGEDFTQEDLASTLESLSEIELNNGQIVKLASKDANEQWKALNI